MSPATPRLPDDDARARLLALADQCVMCGLCAPRCPTYRVLGEEGESPRGRVALARDALLGSRLTSPAGDAHLDHCLTCGNCERACPSDVRVVDLVVGVRTWRRGESREPIFRRLLRVPRVARALIAAARALPERIVRRFARDGSIGASLGIARATPASASSAPLVRRLRPSGGDPRGSVAIFAGCVGTSFERDTLADARAVLAHLGFAVTLVGDGVCCGALDRHRGAAAEATRRAERLGRAMKAWPQLAPLLHVNSGCATDIAHIGADAGVRVASLDAFLAEVLDARATTNRVDDPGATPRRIALHAPCTQRGLPRAEADASVALLSRWRGIELVALEAQPLCCGAAGTQMLSQPALSRPLRDALVARVGAIAPTAVVTANIGCRLQLQAGLRDAGLEVPVHHPVTVVRDILGA